MISSTATPWVGGGSSAISTSRYGARIGAAHSPACAARSVASMSPPRRLDRGRDRVGDDALGSTASGPSVASSSISARERGLAQHVAGFDRAVHRLPVVEPAVQPAERRRTTTRPSA